MEPLCTYPNLADFLICMLSSPLHQHSLLESEANQIRASILDMAHCIRSFTEEVSDYSRKLVGIVQQIEGGEQMVEDGIGMAHTEHVKLSHLVMRSSFKLFLFFHSLMRIPGTAVLWLG